jgi:hypothetical protein
MNAVTPPRRPPPAPVTARAVPGSVAISRIHRSGENVDLCQLQVMFMGLRLDVWLDSDGNATLPRGIALDAADVADVQACAHAAFVEEVVNRLAAQRERRRKSVSR